MLSLGEVSCRQSVSKDGDLEKLQISSLPDEIVFKILKEVPRSSSDLVLVTNLPFVCKKWREILYLQGRHHPPPPISLADVGI